MSGISRKSDDAVAGVTLDSLFRANAASRPQNIALIDPPNRADFTDGVARRLSFADADAEVERLARRLRAFGLPSGSIVAVQLPNIVESVISLLAVLRAGLVAVPVPMLWRRADLVTALAPLEPKALIALTRFDDVRPAEIVCEAAAELFHLSFPCAFGDRVPDGVIALDDAEVGSEVPAENLVPSAGSCIATFDAAAEGFFAVGRNDAQWLAAGMAALLEADMRSGDTIISTLPPNSLAGIGAVLVPWLLTGGTLQLASGGVPPENACNDTSRRNHLIAPAIALAGMTGHRSASFASCIAVHRSASLEPLDFFDLTSDLIVDLYVFGEGAMVPLRREDNQLALPIPLGPIFAPSNAASGTIVLETRTDHGEILLRGPMVPRAPLPTTGHAPSLPLDGDGFVHSGFRCRSDGNGSVIIEGGPHRVATIGALRFGLDDLERRVAKEVEGVQVHAVRDPLLGERLKIEADHPSAAAAALEAAGHSPIVVEAVMQAPVRKRAIG